MLRRFLVIAGLIVGVLAIGGFGLLAQEETIKIGGVGPLSAPGAYLTGIEMKWAMELAEKEINDAGGVLGRKVELVFGDTRGMPEEGIAVMERLITKEGVVGVQGEYHSSVGMAEIEVAHKYHIPFINAECWTDGIRTAHYPEVFAIAVTSSMFVDIQVDWIKAAGFKNVALFSEDTDYGIDQVNLFSRRLPKEGIKFVSTVVDRTREDFVADLLRFKSIKPRIDLFLNNVTGIGGYRVTKQAYDVGLAPTAETAAYNAVDAMYPEFWENVGEAGKYVNGFTIGLPEAAWNDKTRAFTAAFEEKFNRLPGPSALEAYDTFYLMVEAIRVAGSTDPDKIIDALENIKWTGVGGEYFFPYGLHNPLPEDVPAYMWHQWPNPPLYVFQFTEVNQTYLDAPILWPKRWATIDKMYIKVPSE